MSRMHDSLTSMLQQRPLILVSGKGGVGKTTVSAALAVLAAKHCGACTVVESVVHPRLPELLAGHPELRCVNIEVEEELSGFLGHLMRLPQVLGALLRNRVVRLFLRTAPAVSELVLLDAIASLLAEARQKAQKKSPPARPCPVIVDLPATGHALTLLSTPRAVRRMLRVGPVARLAEQLEDLLVDAQQTELLVVTLPEELPINESIEVVAKLRDLGVSCQRVLINQVPQPEVSDSDRDWLRQVGQQSGHTLGSAAKQACLDLAGADAAAEQMQRLQDATQLKSIKIPCQQNPEPRSQLAAVVEVLGS